MRTAFRLSVVSALLSVTALVPASPAAAETATSTPLPIDRAVAVALDEARGQLFVSTGPDGNEILVTDLAGTELRRLNGLAGPSGLLLDGDTLYVALHGGGAIAAFDTGTLAETGRWSLPEGACPDELARTADRLVFAAPDCDPGMGRSWLGTLDTASGAVTTTLSLQRQPVIAANPASNGLVAVADSYTSQDQLRIYDVRGEAPTFVRAAPDSVGIDDVAMAADGRSVLVSGYNGGWLAPLDTLALGLPMVSSSAAGAWSGDGTHLVTTSGQSLTVWPAGETATSSGVIAPYGTSPGHGRLAVDRTASRAWVVSTDYYGGSPALVRYDLVPNGTAWTLSASRLVLPAYTHGTLRADLRVGGQPIEDGTRVVVLVERADEPLTTMALYTSGGGISFSVFGNWGVTRYFFSHYDSVYGIAEAYADVIGAVETRLTVFSEPQAPLYPDSYLSWFARLTDPEDRALAGKLVTLSRTSAAGTDQLAQAYTDSWGYVSFQVRGNGSAGAFTFTLRYAGDESFAPVEHTTQLTIDKKDPYVSISATRGSGPPQRVVTVVGRLGDFHTNRTLTLTATPIGGKPQVIARGEVDQNYTLTAQYTLQRETTFTVSYAGDEWFKPAEASVKMTLR